MKSKTHLFARRLAITLLALFTTTMAWADDLELLDGYKLTAYAENSYLINSADDWNALAAYVKAGHNCSGLTFKLTDNIGTTKDPITTTMGCQTKKDDSNSRKRFAGIFDGDGHTITVDLSSAETNKNYCAPFAYVQNVTIKNLNVAGTITASGQFGSGLIGSTGKNSTNGACTIDNCHVSVEIIGLYKTKDSKFPNHGGFIGVAEGNATFTDCLFDGNFSGIDFQHSGGFIGLNKQTTTFTNCLFNPIEINIENNNYANAHEFANCVVGKCNYVNSYYATPFGSNLSGAPQGKQANTTAIDGCEHTTVNLYGKEYIINTVSIKVNGYGESDSNNGWAFIAIPMEGSVTPEEAELIKANEYDLYRFNQMGKNGEWENYKAHTQGFTINNGCGYLYASKNEATLTFTNKLNTESEKTIDLVFNNNAPNAKGWNLVGNPFPTAAYVDRPFYRMNAEGSGIEPVENYNDYNPTTIPACTGIMVKATGKNETVTFSTSKPSMASSNHGNLQIALTQSNTRHSTIIDKAIVSFNDSKLGKYYFGESNANIYIPQNDEDYAIASCETQGEMPLNFKATVDGEYTITVNPNEVEMNYLHLIDNITGTDIDLLTNSSYTFTAKTTDYASRFRLVFSAENNLDETNDNEEFAYVNNGEIIVNGTGTIQVIDLAGRQLFCHDINSELRIANSEFTTGVYMLRLIEGDHARTQKIVVK